MEIKCPKCGSLDLSANKKGWTVTTGMIGSGKILITCLKCGKQFKPGEDLATTTIRKQKEAEMRKKPAFWIFFFIVLIIFGLMVKGCFF